MLGTMNGWGQEQPGGAANHGYVIEVKDTLATGTAKTPKAKLPGRAPDGAPPRKKISPPKYSRMPGGAPAAASAPRIAGGSNRLPTNLRQGQQGEQGQQMQGKKPGTAPVAVISLPRHLQGCVALVLRKSEGRGFSPCSRKEHGTNHSAESAVNAHSRPSSVSIAVIEEPVVLPFSLTFRVSTRCVNLLHSTGMRRRRR